MPQSRRFTVPIDGVGNMLWPYGPKYAKDGGVTGFEYAEYDWDNNTVTATFHGNEDVLESISNEVDVVEVYDYFS